MTMSSTRHIVLGVALFAALAVAGGRSEAMTAPSSDEIVAASTSYISSDDGAPPTTGPTNPTGPWH
jgi:hypothetical protein